MITYQVKIDTADPKLLTTDMEFVTGDVGAYKMVFSFYENGKPLDITGSILSVKAKRADGVVLSDTGECAGNQATFVPKNALYAVAGELRLEVALSDTAKNYTTTKILLANVLEGAGAPQSVAEDDVNIYVTLLNRVQQQLQTAERMVNTLYNEDLSYLGNLKNSEGEGSVAQKNGGVTNSSGSQTEASVAKGKSAAAFGARGIAKGDATFTAGYKSRAYQVGSAGFGSSTAGDENKQNVFDAMLALATNEADLYANYETYKAQYNETHTSNPLTLDLAGFKEAKYSFSFAACEDNKALARSSAVFGKGNVAEKTAKNTFVAGENNIAAGEGQVVFGKYSEADTRKPFIIGGGSSASTRKNIVAVDRQGTIGAKNIDDYVYTFETTRKVEQNVSASYADISSENGVLKIVSTSLANCPEITDTDLQTDPQIFHRFPIPFKGSVYQYVKIKYKAEKAENLNPRIHFITKGKAEVYENWVGALFSDEKIVVEMTTDDDGWTTAILNMSNYEEWSNDFIATIRLDITNDKYVGDVAYIQYFGVFKSLAEAERYEPSSVQVSSLGDDLIITDFSGTRRKIIFNADGSVTWSAIE